MKLPKTYKFKPPTNMPIPKNNKPIAIKTDGLANTTNLGNLNSLTKRINPALKTSLTKPK